MSGDENKIDLDFTAHFAAEEVKSEKIPAPEKVVLDPEFRIGTSKLEADGFFVAVARRNLAGPDLPEDCHVMVVEDEPVTNSVLQKVLATDGFKVHGAFDAAGLGQLLTRRVPDLILLDIELPKVSGLQILARIRKHPRLHAIPVLIVTSRADMSDVVRGFALGANGYLSKPVTVENLRAVLRQILGALPRKP